VLATQTLPQQRRQDDGRDRRGRPAAGVTAKDVASRSSAARHRRRHRPRHRVPGRGDPRALDGGRMTVCNMSDRGRRARRAGRAGRDDVRVPRRVATRCARGRRCSTRPLSGAPSSATTARVRRRGRVLDADRHRPRIVTWGTNPARSSASLDGVVPDPTTIADPDEARATERALDLHGPHAGHADARDRVDRSSSARAPTRGSRTCAPRPRSRRAATSPSGVRRWSCRARTGQGQAEAEGLDQIFRAAGFEWREPGCSMCLA
jgi:3-isopropylmalate/(R)-2-methylmalate dehydratase large subunit